MKGWPTSHQGAPQCLMGPSLLRLTQLRLYKFYKIGKPTQSHPEYFFHCRKFPFPQRFHLEAFSSILPEGESIMEGFYITLSALSMMCEQFTTDLRVHSQQLDDFLYLFDLQYNVLLDVLGDLLRWVCWDPMNCGFMIILFTDII